MADRQMGIRGLQSYVFVLDFGLDLRSDLCFNLSGKTKMKLMILKKFSKSLWLGLARILSELENTRCIGQPVLLVKLSRRHASP
jgi:hypothetical protein